MVSQATAPGAVYRARDTRHQSWWSVHLPAECRPSQLGHYRLAKSAFGQFSRRGPETAIGGDCWRTRTYRGCRE